MKKLFCLLIVLVVAFSCFSSFALADKHLFAHYSLFVDGEFYNSFFNAGFKFDTQMYDVYLYDDFSGALFSKEEWYYGQRINYGLKEAKYTSSSSSFTLTFDDGSTISGYWDENDEDMWLNLGGDSYFRLHPVPSFDIQKDMVNK